MKLSPLPVQDWVLDAVARGEYYQPHAVLGAHLDSHGCVTFRVLRKFAASVTVLMGETELPLAHEHEGIWVGCAEATQPGHVPEYRLRVCYPGEEPTVVDDPYRYLPTLGELDLHLITEGRHEQLWRVLGARVRHYHTSLGAVSGTSFAVWAPNARAARVVGSFNGWDGRCHPMRSLGSCGVWELFIPDVGAGQRYKFQFLTKDNRWVERADPLARATEVPPATASVVVDSHYRFNDEAWMSSRAARPAHQQPLSIYEVHLGSWRPGLNYRELAEALVEYVGWLGYTHVEFLPVAEHPFGGSWGYQVTGYYAPTSRFGSPDDFKYLIDQLHQAGIGVILDWVPAHFPKDEWALACFDGQPLYEYADPRKGEHPDWGTLVFDYGRNEVRNFLVANALYWFEEFHIDGLRVDAVASMLYLDYSRPDGGWVPNEHGGRENLEAISFLQEVNATAYKRYRGIMMIAEESTAFPGVTAPTDASGLGFGFKWNMGWMHDTLKYVGEDPVNRRWHHHQLTFSLDYAFSENYILPISHDEVVHGKASMVNKMPGNRWEKMANLRAYYAYQWAHPGKKLLFMGCEFAQHSEWSEAAGLAWHDADAADAQGMQKLIRDLNKLYRSTPALYAQDHHSAGFQWVDGGDAAHNVISFLRWDLSGTPLLCVVNFSGTTHQQYRIGVPRSGVWHEVLNTDADVYGGSGAGNLGKVRSQPQSSHGFAQSVQLTLPALSAQYFAPSTAE